MLHEVVFNEEPLAQHWSSTGGRGNSRAAVTRHLAVDDPLARVSLLRQVLVQLANRQTCKRRDLSSLRASQRPPTNVSFRDPGDESQSELGLYHTPHTHLKLSSITRGLHPPRDGDQRRVRRGGSQKVNASGSRRRTTAALCPRQSSRLSWTFQNGDCCKHHRYHRYHQLCSTILVLYIDRDHICRRSCHNNDSFLE